MADITDKTNVVVQTQTTVVKGPQPKPDAFSKSNGLTPEERAALLPMPSSTRAATTPGTAPTGRMIASGPQQATIVVAPPARATVVSGNVPQPGIQDTPQMRRPSQDGVVVRAPAVAVSPAVATANTTATTTQTDLGIITPGIQHTKTIFVNAQRYGPEGLIAACAKGAFEYARSPQTYGGGTLKDRYDNPVRPQDEFLQTEILKGIKVYDGINRVIWQPSNYDAALGHIAAVAAITYNSPAIGEEMANNVNKLVTAPPSNRDGLNKAAEAIYPNDATKRDMLIGQTDMLLRTIELVNSRTPGSTVYPGQSGAGVGAQRPVDPQIARDAQVLTQWNAYKESSTKQNKPPNIDIAYYKADPKRVFQLEDQCELVAWERGGQAGLDHYWTNGALIVSFTDPKFKGKTIDSQVADKILDETWGDRSRRHLGSVPLFNAQKGGDAPWMVGDYKGSPKELAERAAWRRTTRPPNPNFNGGYGPNASGANAGWQQSVPPSVTTRINQ